MKQISLIAGGLAGFLSLIWATVTMNFFESLGLALIVGTAIEWLVAFFTKKDLAITTDDLKQQALRISQTLRELQGEDK